MAELEELERFDVEELGLAFIDRRRAAVEVQNGATLLFGRHLIEDWRATRGANPPPGLCSDDVTRENTIAERWDAFRALRHPEEPDFAEFEQTGGTVTREVDLDPRLFSASLVALELEGGAPAGTLGLHNLRVNFDAPDRIDCAAYLIPGLGARGDYSAERVWAIAALHLLRFDLEMDGGRWLDVSAILLPDDSAAVSFARDEAGGMRGYFDELEAGGAVFEYSAARPGVVVRVELGG